MKMFTSGLFTMLRCWGRALCLSVGSCVGDERTQHAGAHCHSLDCDGIGSLAQLGARWFPSRR